ncbi:MAG: hypothetical protein WB791_06570 [Waddliaceae bacterium]
MIDGLTPQQFDRFIVPAPIKPTLLGGNNFEQFCYVVRYIGIVFRRAMNWCSVLGGNGQWENHANLLHHLKNHLYTAKTSELQDQEKEIDRIYQTIVLRMEEEEDELLEDGRRSIDELVVIRKYLQNLLPPDNPLIDHPAFAIFIREERKNDLVTFLLGKEVRMRGAPSPGRLENPVDVEHLENALTPLEEQDKQYVLDKLDFFHPLGKDHPLCGDFKFAALVDEVEKKATVANAEQLLEFLIGKNLKPEEREKVFGRLSKKVSRFIRPRLNSAMELWNVKNFPRDILLMTLISSLHAIKKRSDNKEEILDNIILRIFQICPYEYRYPTIIAQLQDENHRNYAAEMLRLCGDLDDVRFKANRPKDVEMADLVRLKSVKEINELRGSQVEILKKLSETTISEDMIPLLVDKEAQDVMRGMLALDGKLDIDHPFRRHHRLFMGKVMLHNRQLARKSPASSQKLPSSLEWLDLAAPQQPQPPSRLDLEQDLAPFEELSGDFLAQEMAMRIIDWENVEWQQQAVNLFDDPVLQKQLIDHLKLPQRIPQDDEEKKED